MSSHPQPQATTDIAPLSSQLLTGAEDTVRTSPHETATYSTSDISSTFAFNVEISSFSANVTLTAFLHRNLHPAVPVRSAQAHPVRQYRDIPASVVSDGHGANATLHIQSFVMCLLKPPARPPNTLIPSLLFTISLRKSSKCRHTFSLASVASCQHYFLC